MRDDVFGRHFDPSRESTLRKLALLQDPIHVGSEGDPRVAGGLGEIEVLITSWGAPQLTGERLKKLPSLKAVFHAAGSVRGIVSDALWERKIIVTNAADENAIPVAEFAYAAIVWAGKKAPFFAADVRQQRTNRTNTIAPSRWGRVSNYRTSVAIIGFSRIGQRVAAMLRNLDSVEVLVVDPIASNLDVSATGARLVSLSEALANADIVSIHAPDLPSTKGLIGDSELAQMKDHTTIINTARGALIDTEALERECGSGRLNAILDVTWPEEIPTSSLLYDLPNVMLTPHIAGSLDSEIFRMTDAALEELRRYAGGEQQRSLITPEALAVSA